MPRSIKYLHFSGDSDDERDYAAEAAKKEKKARESLIKNEFALRRKLASKNAADVDADDVNDDSEAIRNARVRGAEFTSKKIHCLEVKARESYLKLLEQLMKENFDSFLKHSSSSDRPRALTKVRLCPDVGWDFSRSIRRCVTGEYQIQALNAEWIAWKG